MRYHKIYYKYKRQVVFGFSVLLLAMIYFFKDASFILRACTMIALIVFFYVVDHFFDVRFRAKHYLFIFLIGISSILLSPLYFIYPNYDKIQHFLQPILVASIIFFMVNKHTLRLKWKLAFVFFITIALLGLFEIGEYALDVAFDFKLQGVYIRDITGTAKYNLIVERIDDTMIDMILGVIGTGLYCLGMYVRMRKR